jgi:prepilin-type N-terminal cleavage/methylation domain-containing protein
MTTTRASDGSRSGFTLVEVMVAAFLITIVFFGAAHYASKSRGLMQHDESRRHAVAIAQGRLESIRTYETYDTLNTLAGRDTTYTVDGRPFTLIHTVTLDSPQTSAATVTVNLAWNVNISGNLVPRTLSMSSILSRSIGGS